MLVLIQRCDLYKKEKDDYWNRYITQAQNIKNASELIKNEWSISDSWCEDLTYWDFQAPDEDEPRKFKQAVERQKILDKCKELNLPIECGTALKEEKCER